MPTPLPTRSGIAIVATTTSAAPTTTIARHGFAVVDAGVFWPTIDEELSRLVTIKPFASSDHRLVWVDLA